MIKLSTNRDPLKAIQKDIATLRRSGEEWNTFSHNIAVRILHHAAEHGDCTEAFNLFQAFGVSKRRELLALWFQRYSPIAIKPSTADKPGKSHYRKETAQDYNPFDIDGAEANPWYAMPEAAKIDNKAMELLSLKDADKAILGYLSKLRQKALKQMEGATEGDQKELKITSEYCGRLFDAIRVAGMAFAEEVHNREAKANDSETVTVSLRVISSDDLNQAA